MVASFFDTVFVYFSYSKDCHDFISDYIILYTYAHFIFRDDLDRKLQAEELSRVMDERQEILRLNYIHLKKLLFYQNPR